MDSPLVSRRSWVLRLIRRFHRRYFFTIESFADGIRGCRWLGRELLSGWSSAITQSRLGLYLFFLALGRVSLMSDQGLVFLGFPSRPPGLTCG